MYCGSLASTRYGASVLLISTDCKILLLRTLLYFRYLRKAITPTPQAAPYRLTATSKPTPRPQDGHYDDPAT